MKNELGEKLRKAAKKGTLDEVKRCLAGGADVDFKDDGGNTALMWAAFNGHLRVVEMLLEEGADPLLKSYRQKTDFDHTALDCALQQKREDVVRAIENHIKTANHWKKTGDRQIRNRSRFDGNEILMIQHFDFSSSLCTTILTHPGGAVSHSCGGFHTMPPALIREAAGELARQGGTPVPGRSPALRPLVQRNPVI